MNKHLFMFAVGSLVSLGALATSADDVVVVQPYVRQAPPNAPATGAFMVLRNSGAKDAKVLKAESSVAKVTELHTHTNDNGVMKMRPVPAIDIKAGGEAVLQPGGLHVMLIDLKAPLKASEPVPITLIFEDGSSKRIEAPVVSPMAGGQGEHKH